MGIAAPTPDDQPHTLLGDDMAEYQYVRTGAMWLMGRYKLTAQTMLAQLVSGSATCWDAAVDGNQVEGVKVNGNAVSSLAVDSDGYLPETWTAPVPTMWLDGGTGARVMAVSLDITGLSGHVAATDPHPGYLLESTYTTKGDLVVGSDSGPLRLPIGGTDGMVPTVSGGTLVYADPTPDTNWRDVSGLLKPGLAVSTVSGLCQMRRIGAVVYAWFRLDVSASGLTGLLTGIPASSGMRPDEYFLPGQALRTGTTKAAYYPNTVAAGYLNRTLGFQVPQALPNPGVLEWMTSYPVTDPFPEPVNYIGTPA